MDDLSLDERVILGSVNAHAMRHAFGTPSVADEVPVHFIQKVFRHVSLHTTSTYVQEEKKRVLEEVAGCRAALSQRLLGNTTPNRLIDCSRTMASKPKKRKAGRSTPPLSREQLLPISVELACKASLHYHMTLAALRRGQGNADLVSVLLKAVYVAHYLLQPEQSASYTDIFAQAETVIKAAIKTAAATSEWRLAETDCEGIESILRLHDVQLASLPKHRVEGAKDRLMRVLERGSFPALSPSISQ